MSQLQTPVLFLVFNRPETTLQVFEAIKKAQPKQLFVAADGPRPDKPEDIEKCRAVRELIINGVDWDCEVKTLFRDENLGCGIGVSGAISWFFDHVEEGIILEDDCLPSLSFFRFCEFCLEKYRENERIMHIGGDNFQKRTIGNTTYFYSAYFHVWGWATWKRAWEHYLFDISNINDKELENIIGNYFDMGHKAGWINHFSKIIIDKTLQASTWDYQWMLCCLKNKALSIYPNLNLVKNIGFGAGATHTSNANSMISNLPCWEIEGDIVSPKKIVRNKEADNYTSQVIGGFEKNNLKRKLILLMKNVAKKCTFS